MPVIKRSNPTPAAEHAVVLDLGDLAAEAARMRDEARGECDRLLAQTRAEARREGELIRAQAAKEGREAGLAEGREEGLAAGRAAALEELRPQLEELARNWSGALEQWRSQRQAMLRQAREDVLVFAFALARRVVHRIVEIEPEVVEDQLRSALTLVSRPSEVEVAVHPEDRSLLEIALPQLIEQLGQCEHIRLRNDVAVGRGGCILRAAGGTIDATIDTQLARIAETLLPPRARRAADRPEQEPEGTVGTG